MHTIQVGAFSAESTDAAATAVFLLYLYRLRKAVQ
jgi:hypothetical protein